MIIVDGNVSGVPCVGVPNCKDDRGGDERSEETVEDSIEGVDEGVPTGSKLAPVPGREGVEANTTNAASDRSQADVVWGNPGHPVEVGHGLDEIAGEPGVDEHGAETIHEPSHPRDGPAVNDPVGLGMEGSLRGIRGKNLSRTPKSPATYVQRDNCQARWPNGTRWVYEESPSETSETVSDKIGR